MVCGEEKKAFKKVTLGGSFIFERTTPSGTAMATMMCDQDSAPIGPDENADSQSRIGYGKRNLEKKEKTGGN